MRKRTLRITMNAHWQAALRAAGQKATARSYQGEVLNFETAGASSASSPSAAGPWCMRCKARARCRCASLQAAWRENPLPAMLDGRKRTLAPGDIGLD